MVLDKFLKEPDEIDELRIRILNLELSNQVVIQFLEHVASFFEELKTDLS